MDLRVAYFGKQILRQPQRLKALYKNFKGLNLCMAISRPANCTRRLAAASTASEAYKLVRQPLHCRFQQAQRPCQKKLKNSMLQHTPWSILPSTHARLDSIDGLDGLVSSLRRTCNRTHQIQLDVGASMLQMRVKSTSGKISR